MLPPLHVAHRHHTPLPLCPFSLQARAANRPIHKGLGTQQPTQASASSGAPGEGEPISARGPYLPSSKALPLAAQLLPPCPLHDLHPYWAPHSHLLVAPHLQSSHTAQTLAQPLPELHQAQAQHPGLPRNPAGQECQASASPWHQQQRTGPMACAAAHLGVLQQVLKARDGDRAVTCVLPVQCPLQLPQLLLSLPHVCEKLGQRGSSHPRLSGPGCQG